MYTLEISEGSLKKLEKIGKEFSGMDNKIVKEAKTPKKGTKNE